MNKKLSKPSNWLQAEIYGQDMTVAEAAQRLQVTQNALRRALLQMDHLWPGETGLRLGEMLGLQRQLVLDYCTKYRDQSNSEASYV